MQPEMPDSQTYQANQVDHATDQTPPPSGCDAAETSAQLRAMQALTDTALSHLALDDLLRELLGRVTDVMGVDQVGILLLDADGRTLTLRSACGLLEAAPGYDQFAMGQGFPGRIAASRESLIVNAPSAADFDGTPPVLRERVRSAVGVPLLVDGQVAGRGANGRLVGVLAVGSTTPRRFSEADVELLQRAADRIALAIDRARLYAAEQEARQRAETALARAQASEAQAAARAQQLHTILETIADGVAVLDTDGRVQVANRAYRELHVLEPAPAGLETLPLRERVGLLDGRDAATGAPLPGEAWPGARALAGEVVTGPGADVHLRTFDGRELDLNTSAAPLHDAEGHVAGAVLVLRDMTEHNHLAREREAAREQAERQADQLDRIFETAADGLLVWDTEGQLVRANPAARRILGLDAAPPSYEHLPLPQRMALYAARDEQGRPLPLREWPVLSALHGEVATGTGAGTEARDLRIRALDGREIELNSTTAPLRDREGHLVGGVNVLHDLTERNRLERERAAARADELAAREASRRLEAFLATAAHDLRTPLSTTIGYIGLAERRTERLAAVVAQEVWQEEHPDLAQQVEAVQDRLEEADQSAARLARLLTLLFDTAAIRAGKLGLHRAPCDLAALVREQVAALRVAAPDRTITLQAPAGDRPIQVEVDADRIGQVVTNYVTNALKYAPPDQPVDVCVEMHGNRARVAVRDAGPGIPKPEQARVWELFHRAPEAAAQAGAMGQKGPPGRMPGQSGSLGLGLYISKAIIQAHGGRVGVASVVGQGSTFWFTLPLARAHTDSHAEARADATTP